MMKLYRDNIKENGKPQFKIEKNTRTLGVSYDPLSIMHYFYYAFAKDHSKPTIVSKVTYFLSYFAFV